MSLATYFKLAATGPDNTTPDVARLIWMATWALWVLTVLAFIGVAVATWKTTSLHDYAEGVAHLIEAGSAVLVTGGVSVAVKGHTEPKPNE